MPTQKDKITLAEIFFPRAFAKFEAARNDKTRFVHYTNADAAMKILRSEKVWMRQSSCMNDFMEVIYGIECVTEALNAPCGEIFKSALNKAHTDVYDEINQNFEQRKLSLTTDTYLTCISEHEEKEDDFGRLSMWRAYSDTTGVALVMNNTVFINESHTLGAYTSPVAYLNKEEFKTEFG